MKSTTHRDQLGGTVVSTHFSDEEVLQFSGSRIRDYIIGKLQREIYEQVKDELLGKLKEHTLRDPELTRKLAKAVLEGVLAK